MKLTGARGDVGAYSDTLQVTLQELTRLGFTTINVTICKSHLKSVDRLKTMLQFIHVQQTSQGKHYDYRAYIPGRIQDQRNCQRLLSV